jgi:hypothetical protein
MKQSYVGFCSNMGGDEGVASWQSFFPISCLVFISWMADGLGIEDIAVPPEILFEVGQTKELFVTYFKV